jgi:hypothetical protein
MGQNLNGAHNSLVDVKAQTDIVTSRQFLPFIDRSKSIRPMDELFSRATQRQMAKELEPSRPVHEPWVEFDEHNTLDWEPRRDDTYNGSQAGGRCGPSNGAEAAAKAGGLVSLFFSFSQSRSLKALLLPRSVMHTRSGSFPNPDATKMVTSPSDQYSFRGFAGARETRGRQRLDTVRTVQNSNLK